MYALSISYAFMLLLSFVVRFLGRAATGGGAGAGSALMASGCFMSLSGLAVLVFLIMYLRLVERMGARFKEQAAIARSTWAATAFAPPPAAHP
jgi:hypothetical protein